MKFTRSLNSSLTKDVNSLNTAVENPDVPLNVALAKYRPSLAASCIEACSTINAKCFRGGDVNHKRALDDAVKGLGNCWEVYDEMCKGELKPVPVPQPGTISDRSFKEKVEAVTGYSGIGLIIYLIISESTRLFLPRNLVPVP